jgi:hypothetical protein
MVMLIPLEYTSAVPPLGTSRILSPVIYAAVVAAVFIGMIAAIAWLERHIGLHTIWRTGDVDLAIVGALLGGATFPAATLVLTRLESLDRPGYRDHVRHCALLYPVVALSCAWLLATRPELGRGLQWGLVATTTMMAIFAALVNAATLKVLATRSARHDELGA